MRPPVAPSRRLAGLGLACLACGSLLAWQLARDPAAESAETIRQAASERAPTGSVATPAMSSPAIAPPADLSAISARPAFVPSRRPAPAVAARPAAAPPPPPPQPPALTLLGIAGEPGRRVALVRHPTAPAAFTLVEGAKVEGWQVLRILVDRIVIRSNSDERQIPFPAPADRPPAAPGGSAPPRLTGNAK